MNRIDALSKNYLINGAMDFSQRLGTNGTGLIGAGLVYALDRWRSNRLGNWSGNVTIRKEPVSVTNKPRLNRALKTHDANATDSTAKMEHDQLIESIFAKELAGQPISVGFDYNESEFQQVDIQFFYATVEDDFSSHIQIGSIHTLDLTPDSTWREVVLENILMPAQVVNGLIVRFTFKNPANTGVEIVSHITGCKLNIGEKLQEFSLTGRDIHNEFLICQRYYEKSYQLDDEPGTAVGADLLPGFVATTRPDGDNRQDTQSFKVRKRSIPICTIYAWTGAINSAQETNGPIQSANSIAASEHGFIPNITASANGVGARFAWTADAEL